MMLKALFLRPPLYVSLNISAARPLGQKSTYRFLKDSLAAEILRETCKGGLKNSSFSIVPMISP